MWSPDGIQPAVPVVGAGTTAGPTVILTVRAPQYLRPERAMGGENPENTDAGTGYCTTIYYRIYDQLNTGMPGKVPMTECFPDGLAPYTSNPIDTRDYGAPDGSGPSGWMGQDLGYTMKWGGGIVGDGYFSDQVMYPGPADRVPLALNPQKPLGTVKICHLHQVWSVGSMAWGTGQGHPSAGKHVQLDAIQKYQDHAEHALIHSPCQPSDLTSGQ